jgi:hypothetical protein
VFSLDQVITGRSLWPSGLGMNWLHLLERWVPGFEPHSRHGCLCAFILCLCCSVCSSWSGHWLIPRPRNPTDCEWIKEVKKRRRPTRAVDR